MKLFCFWTQLVTLKLKKKKKETERRDMFLCSTNRKLVETTFSIRWIYFFATFLLKIGQGGTSLTRKIT